MRARESARLLCVRLSRKRRVVITVPFLLVGDAPYYERFGFFADKTRHLMMPGPSPASASLRLN